MAEAKLEPRQTDSKPTFTQATLYLPGLFTEMCDSGGWEEFNFKTLDSCNLLWVGPIKYLVHIKTFSKCRAMTSHSAMAFPHCFFGVSWQWQFPAISCPSPVQKCCRLPNSQGAGASKKLLSPSPYCGVTSAGVQVKLPWFLVTFCARAPGGWLWRNTSL